MQNFDFELGDKVPMETAEDQTQDDPQNQDTQDNLQEQVIGTTQQPQQSQQTECKFNESAIYELRQQMAGLQDLFVRRLYDDKQKTALINSLEEKATFSYMEPFLSDIILVLDRLEKASPENHEFASSITDELYEIINRRGVERIKVTQRFDPALNKAIRVENDETADTPRVSKIIRNGYTFNGRVIRPAEVVVARKKRGN